MASPLYDRIIYPLFTRPFYEDKNRQERLICESTLDWALVRPAPFKAAAGSAPFEIVTDVRLGTVLHRITRDEVASFLLDQLGNDRYLRKFTRVQEKLNCALSRPIT